ADGRHRTRGDGAAYRIAASTQAPFPNGTGGARHDGGVRVGGPHFRAALRPRARHRSAARGARQSAGGRRLSRRRDGVRMLAVEHLQAAYGPAQVLFDISFRVGAGEVVTLLGRNGMGKTTTIAAIMGLL